MEACRQTYRALYIRMPDLMCNFENQSDNLRELTEYRKRIGNYHILILDKWLNYKLSEKDAKNLYELFEQCSGNHSTVFVGQYLVDECITGSAAERRQIPLWAESSITPMKFLQMKQILESCMIQGN